MRNLPQGLLRQPNLDNTNLPQGIKIGIPSTAENKLIVQFPSIADDTFTSYKFYQIEKNQVPETQTNMPLVIKDTLGPDVLLQADGFDIRVFDSDGIGIPYDRIESNKATGKIIVWINMNLVKDLEFVQLTFGKVSATDGSDSAAVYDSNFKNVYHLNGTGKDSSSNNQDLAVNGTTGNGLKFDGVVTDYLIRNPVTGFPLDAITYEFVIKTETNNPYTFITYAVDGTPIRPNEFGLLNPSVPVLFIGVNNFFLEVAFNDNTFHYVVIEWRSSDGRVLVYVDSKLKHSSTGFEVGTLLDDGGSLVLGQDQDIVGGGFEQLQSLVGIMQENIISDINRSAEYVNTKFKNMFENDTFWFKTELLTKDEDNFLIVKI